MAFRCIFDCPPTCHVHACGDVQPPQTCRAIESSRRISSGCHAAYFPSRGWRAETFACGGRPKCSVNKTLAGGESYWSCFGQSALCPKQHLYDSPSLSLWFRIFTYYTTLFTRFLYYTALFTRFLLLHCPIWGSQVRVPIPVGARQLRAKAAVAWPDLSAPE